MVLECPGVPLGDSEERTPRWDHPKLTQLGQSMRVTILTILTCRWRWHVYPLTQVHSALGQDGAHGNRAHSTGHKAWPVRGDTNKQP